MKTLTPQQFLNITNKNVIKLIYSNSFSSSENKEIVLLPVSKPRLSKKYNVYKLTLKNKANPLRAKFYAYLRNDKVSFAFSDTPIKVKSIEFL